MLAESHQYGAYRLLGSIPYLGPVRASILMARAQVPNRFRTKRQCWADCGLALETRTSAEHRVVNGQLQRSNKPVFIRGLNLNHNHDLKNVFKGAATAASLHDGPLREFYDHLLAKGMKPELARVTLARKIAAMALILWKKGARPTPLGWLYESETG